VRKVRGDDAQSQVDTVRTKASPVLELPDLITANARDIGARASHLPANNITRYGMRRRCAPWCD